MQQVTSELTQMNRRPKRDNNSLNACLFDIFESKKVKPTKNNWYEFSEKMQEIYRNVKLELKEKAKEANVKEISRLLFDENWQTSEEYYKRKQRLNEIIMAFDKKN